MDDSKKLHRGSIRLRKYDYGQPGAYFVTICTHQRECLFGEVEEGGILLSAAGIATRSIWETLPQRYPHTSISVHTIMPNHFHGIIMIDVGAIHESPL